jgi:hypothetical protein
MGEINLETIGELRVSQHPIQGTRRSVVIRGENRWGWPAVRLEFGPWWHRIWLVIRHGGKPHAVITGEPCVRFRVEASDADK